MSRRAPVLMPAPRVRTITEHEMTVLCAWLFTMNSRARLDDVRTLAIFAIDDFGSHPCIRCVDCDPADQAVLRVTQVVEHRMRRGRHRLAPDHSTLRVIP